MPAVRSVFRYYALESKLVTPEQLEQAVLTAGVTADAAAAPAAGEASALPPADVEDAAIASRLVEMGI